MLTTRSSFTGFSYTNPNPMETQNPFYPNGPMEPARFPKIPFGFLADFHLENWDLAQKEKKGRWTSWTHTMSELKKVEIDEGKIVKTILKEGLGDETPPANCKVKGIFVRLTLKVWRKRPVLSLFSKSLPLMLFS